MSTDNTNNPDPQQDVIADYANSVKQIEIEAYERTVRKARNALFWAGGLIVFGNCLLCSVLLKALTRFLLPLQ